MSSRESRAIVRGSAKRSSSKSRDPPDMLMGASKADVNLVLCGNDAILKASVSKCLRGGKGPFTSHQTDFSSECVRRDVELYGRLINVVELPALSQLSEEQVMHQTLCCLSLCQPGVNFFLIIIPDSPLTDGDKAEIEKIQKIFDSREHIMVIFTTELTIKEPVTDLIKSRPDSQKLISRYGDRFRVMGLKEPENSRQIPELLEYIENMKIEPYSLKMYVKTQENRVSHELEQQHKEELRRMEIKIKDLQKKIQSECAEGEAGDLEHLRIMLIGRTGNGKSATRNTILRTEEFVSESRPDSVTTVCDKRVGQVDGRSVAVVDTPNIFDTELPVEQVEEELMKCVLLSSPGPHVFVIVLSVGSFTKEETETVDLIKKILGPKSAQFSIVLFTRGDNLDDKSIEDYVREQPAELKKLIRDCGNRFLVFNNREKQDTTQVTRLLKMVEEVKKNNNGRYYTNSMFEETEMSIKKRMEEIPRENKKDTYKVIYDKVMKDIKNRFEEEKQGGDEKLEKLRKEFEEKEKRDKKKQEIENQKRLEEEKQQRDEYHKKIEEMTREIENLKSQYEKQQKEGEEDSNREEKYRQDKEKMKHEQELIVADLLMKQEEETKKRDLEKKRRNEEEEEERQRWRRKIKEAENDRNEIKEKIKQQQREWEDEKKQQMREREEEERKRKERYEEQLREKQEELEKMRERFEKKREAERQKMEKERQKQRREREEKEREYEEKKTEMERRNEQLEQDRKEEWKRRKREDDAKQEEERNRLKKMIEDLKQEQEEEKKKRRSDEEDRKGREEKEREEMKRNHEEEIKDMKKKHEEIKRREQEEKKREKNEEKEREEMKLKHEEQIREIKKCIIQ